MSEPTREISMEINGTSRAVEVPLAESLVRTLRDRLNLYSVRSTCGIGLCGSCTVLLDGSAVSSCLLLTAMVEGGSVVTAEGLAGSSGGAVQEAFAEHHAYQCSFCIPAMTLSVRELLQRHPAATAAEIREHLVGNLCRCGTYPQILDAVVSLVRAGAGFDSGQPS